MSRAAETLNIAQPWLSTRIRNYEKDLGFDIFDRSRRRLSLTPKGEAFIAVARQFAIAAERLDQAARAIAAQSVPTELHVGSPSAASGVDERNTLLGAFRASNRDVSIRVHLLASDQIMDGLESGRLDLGFLLSPLPRTIATADTLLLRHQHAVIFMPSTWKRSGQAALTLDELIGRDIAVMPTAYHPDLSGPIHEDLRGHGARLVEMADDNFLALHNYAIRHGIGALTVDTFADSLAHLRDYGCYAIEGDPYNSELCLIRPRPGAQPVAAAFWQFAERWSASRRG